MRRPSPRGDRTPGHLYAAPVRASTGIAFIVAGALHFTHRRTYEAMMPDYVPRHRECVAVSGVAEIAGGAAILVPRAGSGARWWLLALLAAVYPANIHMALHPERYRRIPAWALWARLPLQAVFARAVWRATV
jgi:uncharacterized membrane protein